MKDTPHNSGGILVDQPVVLVLRVLPVAVDRVIGGGLTSVSSGLICRALFPAAIPQKPLVYDISDLTLQPNNLLIQHCKLFPYDSVGVVMPQKPISELAPLRHLIQEIRQHVGPQWVTM
jgi:hypothetical protein